MPRRCVAQGAITKLLGAPTPRQREVHGRGRSERRHELLRRSEYYASLVSASTDGLLEAA